MRIPTLRLLSLILLLLCLIGERETLIDNHLTTNSLIKVPLIRTTTEGVGTYGQPVISYYAPISIGTPAKGFNVQFDLALGDHFVPHYEWSPFKVNMHYGKGYQCKLSSTCKKTDHSYLVDYNHCKLTGKPYEDIMTLNTAFVSNGKPGHVSWRQNFLAIGDASDARYKDLPIDGVFGLAPQSTTPVNNILVGLQKNRIIDSLQFSLWFSSVLDSQQGGELILGGVDQARYQGQIYWHHASPAHRSWSLTGLQYVTLGNQPISCADQKCEVTLSSGTNELVGPAKDVIRIYSLLNSSNKDSLQLVDCRRINQMPVLTFFIDGIPYSLLPTNYIRKITTGTLFKSETCYVAILPSKDDQSQWTLGTNFLGAYYSIFDMERRLIGFATLRA